MARICAFSCRRCCVNMCCGFDTCIDSIGYVVYTIYDTCQAELKPHPHSKCIKGLSHSGLN